MRRFVPLFPILLVLVAGSSILFQSVIAADDPAGKADKPAAKKTGDKGAPKDWKGLTDRLEQIGKEMQKLQIEFQSAPPAKRREIQATAQALHNEVEQQLKPELAKLAPARFAKDPSDRIAAQFAMGKLLDEQKYGEVVDTIVNLMKSKSATPELVEVIVGLLYQEQRYQDVVAVVDQAAAAGMASPQILSQSALSLFSSNEFEKAKAAAVKAQSADKAHSPGPQFLKDCDEYAGFWKTEQAIRAKEAKADDLPRVLLKTTKGDIVLELFENEAPNTVANFISLVEKKYYDGIAFHRVIPDFMAQGGDPNTLDDDLANDGQGGPGYTIACECYTDKARKHFQGSLSMAHAGKDTGGSQFFLTHRPTSHLNYAPRKESNHTVFGRVVKGMDAMLALRVGDKIKSATVVRKRDHEYVPKKLAAR